MLKWCLPPQVGPIKIYNELILSVYLDHYGIKAVLVKIGKPFLRVEALFEKSFEITEAPLNRKNYFDKDKLREVFSELISAIPKFDELRIVVSSNLVIFKELIMPFSDSEKIRKVLPFEITPYIVFESQEVSLDFLTTELFPDNRARIMVAVIRDTDFSKLSITLKSLDLSCYKLGVDAFVLYELLKEVPDYREVEHVTCFLELGEKSLVLGFVEKLALTGIRVFEFGFLDILKNIEEETKLDRETVLAYLENKGVLSGETTPLADAVRKEIDKCFEEVGSAMEAFVLGKIIGDKLGKLIIFEGSFAIKNFDAYCADKFQMVSEIFSISSWVLVSKTTFRHPQYEELLSAFIKPLGFVSLSCMKEFNFGMNLFPNPDKNLLSKQLIVCITLVSLMFGYLFLSGFAEVQRLSTLATKKETDVVNALYKLLPKDTQSKKRVAVKKMLTDVETSLAQNETLQKQSGYGQAPDCLVLLLELTRLIDRTRFGVIINNIVIKQDSKDFIYRIYVQGSFEQSKSTSDVDNYTSFLRVLKLSRRLLLESSTQDGDDTSNSRNFSLVFDGLDGNENNG